MEKRIAELATAFQQAGFDFEIAGDGDEEVFVSVRAAGRAIADATIADRFIRFAEGSVVSVIGFYSLRAQSLAR